MNTNINVNLLETGSDELERLVLEEVHKRRRFKSSVSALVIPVGCGELATEMAKLGCGVTGIDDARYESDFRERALATGKPAELEFVPGALDSLPAEIPGGPFDIVYIRRGLSSFPYAQTRQILSNLLRHLKIGGKLYVSVLGMHSELGYHYAGAESIIDRRFCPLDPAMARKYGINDPVCLYSERNLFMLLLEAGGSVLRTFTTTHGNIKGISVRV